MKAFSATINIKMRQGVIWEILVDAPRYPEWDPGTSRIEGILGLGQELSIYRTSFPDEPQTIVVTEFKPGEKMAWTWGLPQKFLFKAVRTFTLTRLRDSSIDFSLREEYSGLTAGAMVNKLPDPSKSFEDFVVGLKTRALSQAGRPMS